MTLLVIYCLVAIVFTFCCSIMESVFLSITPSFVASFEKKNPKIGGYLKNLKNNVDDAEGAILVLNTFATTAAATGVGIQVASLYGLDYQALGAAILTIVLIYFSEILPKTIGATYWKTLAPYVTLSIHDHYAVQIHVLIHVVLLLLHQYGGYFLVAVAAEIGQLIVHAGIAVAVGGGADYVFFFLARNLKLIP